MVNYYYYLQSQKFSYIIGSYPEDLELSQEKKKIEQAIGIYGSDIEAIYKSRSKEKSLGVIITMLYYNSESR